MKWSSLFTTWGDAVERIAVGRVGVVCAGTCGVTEVAQELRRQERGAPVAVSRSGDLSWNMNAGCCRDGRIGRRRVGSSQGTNVGIGEIGEADFDRFSGALDEDVADTFGTHGELVGQGSG